MPTYDRTARFDRDHDALSAEQRMKFRATFQHGDEEQAGQPHIIWRRIGGHEIFGTSDQDT